MKTNKYIATAGVLVAMVTASQASVLVGNGPFPLSGTVSESFSSTAWAAVAIQPAGANLRLNSIDFDISSTAIPVVSVWSDAGGTPGSSVYSSFTTPDQTGNGRTTWTFTASSTFDFSASSVYWLVVRNPGVISGSWFSAASSTYTGPGSYLDAARGTGSPTPVWDTAYSGEKFGFIVNVSAVPEPQEYAMLAGLGLVGFAIWRRRMAAKVA